MKSYIERVRHVIKSYVDRQEREERLSFDILIGRHLRDITTTISVLQICFALLAFIDRLNPTVAASVYYVELLSNDSFWAGAFLLSELLALSRWNYALSEWP